MACYGESLLTGVSSPLLAGAFHHDDNFVTEQASFLHTKLPLALTRDSQSHPGAMNEQQKGPGEITFTRAIDYISSFNPARRSDALSMLFEPQYNSYSSTNGSLIYNTSVLCQPLLPVSKHTFAVN
jgi:hypothetical protein